MIPAVHPDYRGLSYHERGLLHDAWLLYLAAQRGELWADRLLMEWRAKLSEAVEARLDAAIKRYEEARTP